MTMKMKMMMMMIDNDDITNTRYKNTKNNDTDYKDNMNASNLIQLQYRYTVYFVAWLAEGC